MNDSYNRIFKSTALFGVVQVLKAVMTVIKNKVAAILIGPEGVGILGIFSSTIRVIQTGAGLGVNQSAVRDVSEATGSCDFSRKSRIINVTNKVILFTGLLGCLITLVLSRFLADWTFHDPAYTIPYCFIAIVIGLNIGNEGRLALLKGTRQLRLLAIASVIGTAVGLVTSVPLYYFFGKDGIVPELLVSSTLAMLTTSYFVHKIQYEHQKLTLKEIVTEASPMVKMGIAMMFVSFLQTIVALILNTFIRSHGGLEDVGLFSAGVTILHGYFGLLTTALTTDYYPRIAAVNKDNRLLQEELNHQSIVSLLLVAPLLVVFIVFLPFFIKLLYSSEFLPAVDFVRFAIYWTLITTCSNQVDLILVAKYDIKTFVIISIIIRALQLLLCIPLYSLYGLSGLGVSYAILGVIHMLVMTGVVYRKYQISFNKSFLRMSIVVLAIAVSASAINELDSIKLRLILGVLLSIIAICISIRYVKNVIGLSIVKVIMSKFKK